MRLASGALLFLIAITLPLAARQNEKSKVHPKVTMEEAQRAASARQPGSMKSAELEKENGRLIYSFDIETATGVHEVQVDAMTGKVIQDVMESPADEAKEVAKENKEKAKK